MEADTFFLRTLTDSADLTNAVPQFLMALELDTGTAYHQQFGDGNSDAGWATAASHASHASASARAQARLVHRHAAAQANGRPCCRCVAGRFYALHAHPRLPAHARFSPMDDLRQLLRDVRGYVASLNEGSPLTRNIRGLLRTSRLNSAVTSPRTASRP